MNEWFIFHRWHFIDGLGSVPGWIGKYNPNKGLADNEKVADKRNKKKQKKIPHTTNGMCACVCVCVYILFCANKH